MRTKLATWYPRIILVVASAFFAQLYTLSLPPYLNLRRYIAGTERMPFQARELMRYPLGWAMASPLLQHLSVGRRGLDSPALLFTAVSSFLCVLLSGWAAIKIYRWAAPRARASWLPFALLIVICVFTFTLTVPYGFPYDLPSMAFLGWGLYFVLTGRFAALVPTFLLGTWNRETTLFLILALLTVGCFRSGRFSLRTLTRTDLWQAGSLSLAWVAILLWLHRRYAANPTEAGTRLSGNLHDLAHPLLWPNILSASAFLLPYLWLERDRLRERGLRGCVLLVLPLWVALLLWKGQILELRIYGDISVFVAVCAALILSDALGGPAAALAGGSECREGREASN